MQYKANKNSSSATVMRALDVANKVDAVSFMLKFFCRVLAIIFCCCCCFEAVQTTYGQGGTHWNNYVDHW